MNNTNLAWVAGFFDGEGCLNIQNRRDEGKGISFRLTLKQARERGRKVLSKIKEDLNCGNFYHCGASWQYEVSKRDDLKKVLTMLSPFLRIKNEEVNRFLSLLELWESKRVAPKKEWRDKPDYGIYGRYKIEASPPI